MFDKNGELIDSCPFVFNVNLDELKTYYNVKLTVKPLDPCIVITREYTDFNNAPAGFERVCNYESDFFYNDEDDEIILNIFNGFDVAIFNMCSLLGIGRITLDSGVEYEANGFAPVYDKVSTVKFTLDEFKMLDGFVAMIKFTPHFILFKGLLIGANYIHENVHEGDVVPSFKSNDLLRGEKLFILD